MAKSDFFNLIRQQEVELPAVVNVLFINKGADYQQGEQHSIRTSTKSKEVVTVSLPIVMTDTYAKAVADTLMANAWIERVKGSFTLPRKYAYLEPTDVFTLLKEGISYEFRITKKDELADGSIKVEVTQEDGIAYSPNLNVGTGTSTVVSVLQNVVDKSIGVFNNAPLITDSNDSIKWYASVSGETSGWNGAILYISQDSGLNYSVLKSFDTETTIGNSSNAIGVGRNLNLIDYSESIVVKVFNNELYSTNFSSLMNGENTAILGSEVFQYLNAQLIGVKEYRLTGLLRGRKGTEWAKNTHLINEVFVDLNIGGGTQEIPSTLPDIESIFFLKMVSVGDTLANTPLQKFFYRGIDRKPYSPVALRGTRDTAGALIINWVRRSRLSGSWSGGLFIPLNETTEAYVVLILSNTTINISSITLGTVTVINTGTAHLYSSGDLVHHSNIKGPVFLNQTAFIVTVINANSYSVSLHSPGLQAYPNSSGGLSTKVVRTISTTTPTAIYTAENQNTDFGSTQSSINVKVAQISGSVGRGYTTGDIL